MNDTDRTVHRLLKESLYPAFVSYALNDVSECDWEKVFTEMTEQTIEALPYDWLLKHRISNDELYRKWIDKCSVQQGRWLGMMYAQEQMLELFKEHSVPCVIIKGSAAAMAYPNPSLRSFGDVDLLVKRSDFDRAADILKNNGYVPKSEITAAKHHASFIKDGVVFELHRRLPIISDDNERLISLFEDGIDKRTTGSTDPFSFPVLPADLNGLVLLYHIDQHLRSGLGLRQIIDWMMFADANDGYDDMRPILKSTGTELLADTVTVMCQKFFGLREIVKGSEIYPCDELMDYITEKGNFGRKSGMNGKMASVFLNEKKPLQVFKTMQTRGLTRWKAAKKYPILRPFAWLSQVAFYLKLLIKKRENFSDIIAQKKIGDAQKELIIKLGLDIDRTIKTGN